MIVLTTDQPTFRRPWNIDLMELPQRLEDEKSPFAEPVKKFFDRFKDVIKIMPASQANHHWWTGGWRDHIEQVLLFSVLNHTAANPHLGFKESLESIQKLLVIGLLHDAEKLIRYEPCTDQKFAEVCRNGEIFLVKNWWKLKEKFTSGRVRTLQEDLISIQIAAECGFKLEDWLVNGITCAAGGFSDFARLHQPLYLSTFVAMADFVSANVLWNVGTERDDE